MKVRKEHLKKAHRITGSNAQGSKQHREAGSRRTEDQKTTKVKVIR